MHSLTAPFNLRKARILSRLAGFDGVQAFFFIAFLIRANVTLQGVAYGHKNNVRRNEERAFLGSRLLTERHAGDSD